MVKINNNYIHSYINYILNIHKYKNTMNIKINLK